ncbi:VOC family protein [Falsibacillus pallidus]|uniref:VOC family protein n=1 Tax=Falsibacillus pallidus TaxID=493781 RepID=UPI003D954FF7
MGIIQGLYETHLEVENLEESMKFYEEKLELKLGRYEEGRRRAFYLFGEKEESMISIVERKEIDIRHFAFRVAYEDLHEMIPFLQKKGIEIVCGWEGLPLDEPVVYPWLASASVFFNDLDGNRLEFICQLPHERRPEYEKVAVSLSEWLQLQK